MFEKDAEERGNKKIKGNNDLARCSRKSYKDGFKEGAEFGYNKANEWHYLSKGEYPKDNSFVLVWTIDGGITTNYGEEYSDGIQENGLFQGIHISDVIAWKEIIPPKEIEK